MTLDPHMRARSVLRCCSMSQPKALSPLMRHLETERDPIVFEDDHGLHSKVSWRLMCLPVEAHSEVDGKRDMRNLAQAHIPDSSETVERRSIEDGSYEGDLSSYLNALISLRSGSSSSGPRLVDHSLGLWKVR